MRETFKLGILLILLFALSAQAEVVKRYTDGTATANNEYDAKVLAVMDAAGRAFGIDLSIQLDSSVTESSISDSSDSVDSYMQSMNRQISQSINVPDVTPITGYSVNDLYQQADGRWRADVTIEYAWFEQLGAPDDRRSMVVLGGDSSFEKSVQQALQQALVSERRFNILERDLNKLFKSEEAFIKSGSASPAEIARLGRGLGADYLVSVHVDNIYASETKQKHIEVSGESYLITEVDFDYRIKVLEFSSREVKLVLSDKYHKTARNDSSDGSILNLLNNFGTDIAQQITSAIFPMRLMVQANGLLTVNRGNGVLREGQKLNAYRVGETVIDPDSGETLDSLEHHLGVLVVKDVKPKYSIVSFVDAQTLTTENDYVVRFLETDPASDKLDSMRKQKAEEVKKKTQLFLQ